MGYRFIEPVIRILRRGTKTEMLRNETQMAEAVARHMTNSAREVGVGGCVFDVVAYDKKLQLFKLVECKLGSQATNIGHAFGQVAAYCAVLSRRGRDFVDAFSTRVPLRFGRLMEATENAKRIRVAFYVALTDDACKRIELIREVKALLPFVGIIRVKREGKCRNYLKDKGWKDKKLSEARTRVIEILQKK